MASRIVSVPGDEVWIAIPSQERFCASIEGGVQLASRRLLPGIFMPMIPI